MSVYTPLTLKEVQVFAAPYGLEVVELIPIQGGIQNTNYFLRCDNQNEYVLTIFEELDQQAAGELNSCITAFRASGFACGSAFITIRDKPFTN